MMRIATRFAALLLWVALCVGMPAQKAYASIDDIKNIKCENVQEDQLTEAVYNCIKEKLDAISSSFVTTMYEKAAMAIGAAMTLAIAFFGFKFVLMGTRQPKPEFMMFMMKFAVIAALVFGIAQGGGILEFRDIILNAGQEFASMALTGTDAFGGVPPDNIFQAIDQMIFRILGVDNLGAVDKDKDMATIAMVGGLIFSGPLGSKIFAETGWVIGMLMYSFVMALYINIIALIALTFLLTLSPIVLPMALFTYTSYVTQNWFKQIISYSFQPMIVTAFLSMMLVVLGGLFGSYETMVEKSKTMFDDPNVSKFKTLFSAGEVEKNPNKANVTTNSGSGFGGITDAFTSATAGLETMGVAASRQVDMVTKGGSARNIKVPILPLTPKDVSNLMSSTFMLIITAGAMLSFMRELPAWASELAGGDRVTPSLAASQPMESIRENFAPDVKKAKKR